MIKRGTIFLIVCVLVAALLPNVATASDVGADEASRRLATEFTDVNRAVVEATFQAFLDRSATDSELDRWGRALDNGMTEVALQTQVLGMREFWFSSGARLRPFVNALYARTADRPPTRDEFVAARRAYNRTEGVKRFKRRAAAAAVLDATEFDADGFRVNRINVVREPTGFIRTINVRLNAKTTAGDTSVHLAIDGDPVEGEVQFLREGRQLRLVPDGPLLETGMVTARVTSGTRRADGSTFLEAKRDSLFPHVRVVAYYGNHQAPVLGVLGETGPEQAVGRVKAAAARFDRPGRPAVGAFEMIVTVAQSSAGGDGNYSHPSNLGDVKRWIDVARDAGLYVILDIQPGTSDFLTETVRYRELLLEPHVGVALDPEWRMLPGQRPGSVVGFVQASEVNEVSAWLSDLVIENNLPDKMFIVHQFQSRMIQNRETLVDRPGLATIIHADGFGGRAIKLQTYSIINVDRPFWNGFKLFIDEDTQIFQPNDVLSFTGVPVPDLITYQ